MIGVEKCQQFSALKCRKAMCFLDLVNTAI